MGGESDLGQIHRPQSPIGWGLGEINRRLYYITHYFDTAMARSLNIRLCPLFLSSLIRSVQVILIVI
ncbi:hypothetical protein L1987_33101 [Smallanthus sonchifolius]|uniref:Uncharacterized protein n=1 Tax=Smallanthus sonchifolius TaxID=185202 RepID=A0ACB9HQF0_9ASTR|nr:hypothetical protein L1987_33101 [Smallanthus sonchifolius]